MQVSNVKILHIQAPESFISLRLIRIIKKDSKATILLDLITVTEHGLYRVFM